jgi:hypothetical protein
VAIIQAALLLFGVVFLALGYRKTNRNQMLLGAVLLVIGAGAAEFARGFGEGFSDGYNSGLTTHSSGPINRFAIDAAA